MSKQTYEMWVQTLTAEEQAEEAALYAEMQASQDDADAAYERFVAEEAERIAKGEIAVVVDSEAPF